MSPPLSPKAALRSHALCNLPQLTVLLSPSPCGPALDELERDPLVSSAAPASTDALVSAAMLPPSAASSASACLVGGRSRGGPQPQCCQNQARQMTNLKVHGNHWYVMNGCAHLSFFSSAIFMCIYTVIYVQLKLKFLISSYRKRATRRIYLPSSSCWNLTKCMKSNNSSYDTCLARSRSICPLQQEINSLGFFLKNTEPI
mmetsp:Transcript_16240/g.48644  ORF Transcript_16240/g.48644 Transcript_16240/m.48644 type:complete len:201 (+) Transcript_16240:367-969(+)